MRNDNMTGCNSRYLVILVSALWWFFVVNASLCVFMCVSPLSLCMSAVRVWVWEKERKKKRVLLIRSLACFKGGFTPCRDLSSFLMIYHALQMNTCKNVINNNNERLQISFRHKITGPITGPTVSSPTTMRKSWANWKRLVWQRMSFLSMVSLTTSWGQFFFLREK